MNGYNPIDYVPRGQAAQTGQMVRQAFGGVADITRGVGRGVQLSQNTKQNEEYRDEALRQITEIIEPKAFGVGNTTTEQVKQQIKSLDTGMDSQTYVQNLTEIVRPLNEAAQKINLKKEIEQRRTDVSMPARYLSTGEAFPGEQGPLMEGGQFREPAKTQEDYARGYARLPSDYWADKGGAPTTSELKEVPQIGFAGEAEDPELMEWRKRKLDLEQLRLNQQRARTGQADMRLRLQMEQEQNKVLKAAADAGIKNADALWKREQERNMIDEPIPKTPEEQAAIDRVLEAYEQYITAMTERAGQTIMGTTGQAVQKFGPGFITTGEPARIPQRTAPAPTPQTVPQQPVTEQVKTVNGVTYIKKSDNLWHRQ